MINQFELPTDKEMIKAVMPYHFSAWERASTNLFCCILSNKTILTLSKSEFGKDDIVYLMSYGSLTGNRIAVWICEPHEIYDYPFIATLYWNLVNARWL